MLHQIADKIKKIKKCENVQLVFFLLLLKLRERAGEKGAGQEVQAQGAK